MSKPISADFPFESRYIDVNGSKIHYIDEGQGDPVLFLHGNPTSSYLWRNIIPYLTDHARCIAPDLIGMGKSDKPDIGYGFLDSYEYLKGFIEQLDLNNITLVVQDWGSGLGFHYAYEHEDKIKGIAFMEAVYKLLDIKSKPQGIQTVLRLFRFPIMNWLMLGLGNMFIKKMLPGNILRKLSKEEYETYASPFPTIKSRKAVRVWPTEIAIDGKPAHTYRIISEYHKWLKQTEIPKICFYADPGVLIHISEIPWIKGNLPNITLVNVGKGLHFIQEDRPHEIGTELAKWYNIL